MKKPTRKLIKPKRYYCEIETCGREVAIRSTIKVGPNKGKKVCPGCKSKTIEFKPQIKPIKKQTEKNKVKRQTERKGLPEFFKMAIEELKQVKECQNCGGVIVHWLHPQNNVAHVVGKSYYKSVMAHPKNFVLLCASKDGGLACHEKFDSSFEGRADMPVFKIAVDRFKLFRNECTENGREKSIYEKFIKDGSN